MYKKNYKEIKLLSELGQMEGMPIPGAKTGVLKEAELRGVSVQEERGPIGTKIEQISNISTNVASMKYQCQLLLKFVEKIKELKCLK